MDKIFSLVVLFVLGFLLVILMTPREPFLTKEICEEAGGNWNQNISQCQCGGIAGFGCPEGFECMLTGQIADETGVCFPEGKIFTCEEYCKSQPHIACIGHWEISGTFPDCSCKYICDTSL